MKLKRILPYVKELLQGIVKEGDTVVDATAGNGYDTLFLASLVGTQGHVFAFDVQKEAIESTSEKLSNAELRDRVSLILDSHEHVGEYVKNKISAAVFNLGYLPGSNHEVVTTGNSTTKAISSLLDLLEVGGLIVLVVYHGHEGGKQEKDELISFVQRLPQSFVHVLCYQFLNQENDPPFIIAIEKMKER